MPAPRGRIHEKLVRAAGRAAAKETHRRDLARQTTPEQLGRSVREYLGATRIIIASKSEPYQHVRRNGTIESLRSPGGLASALDSVARATGAVWVAQASGDADREVVDDHGRVKMPPGPSRAPASREFVLGGPAWRAV